MRQSVSYLKQDFEDEEVLAYSWIPEEEIVADILTKQGSKHEEPEEILKKKIFRHEQTEDNMVTYEGDEFKIWNLVTKKDK